MAEEESKDSVEPGKVVDIKTKKPLPVKKEITEIPLVPVVQELFRDHLRVFNEANNRISLLVQSIVAQAGANGDFLLSQDGTKLIKQVPPSEKISTGEDRGINTGDATMVPDDGGKAEDTPDAS